MIYPVPVIRTVDLLICGISPSSLNIALTLAQKGFRILAVTAFAYPGEDAAAHYDWNGEHDPALSVFFPEGTPDTPTEFKLRLEQVMIRAGIDFLYQVHPVRPVFDADNAFAGVLAADRTGFQIIAAKAVLDASGRALCARVCGVPFSGFHPGIFHAERFLLGGAAQGAERCSESVRVEGQVYEKFRYAADVNLRGNSARELAEADVALRMNSWSPSTVYASDFARMDPLDGIEPGYEPSGKLPIFFPGKTGSLEELLRTRKNGAPAYVGGPRSERLPFDTVRLDRTERFSDCVTVDFELNDLASGTAEEYDVLVAGGGTGGAPAAISAGRAGAKTICLEALTQLGGIMTSGRICAYWYGNVCGFTSEIDEGCVAMGPHADFPRQHPINNADWKAHYFLREAVRAGCEIAFGTFAVAALKEGTRVAGVLAVSPYGLRVIRAKAVVDATGNADMAAAAGAECRMASPDEPAVQGAGLSPFIPGTGCANTDFQFITDHDILDTTRAFVMGRAKFSSQFDLIQIPNTRERRRIVGDITLQPQDFYAARTWSDTICCASSNFDTHGFTVHPMFLLQPPGEEPRFAAVPLRAMLPKHLTGILVTGLAMSAHRDCMPLIRMQPDVQNQGYAAGLAAAMAAKNEIDFRQIDIRALQKRLAEKGILSARVTEERDGVPAISPRSSHSDFVQSFLYPEEAVSRIRAKFIKNPTVRDAELLAFLGDDSGALLLCETLDQTTWDSGWNYRGMGQFGMSASPVDVLILALAAIRRGTREILKKAALLTTNSEFSHIRAVSRAFQALPARDAAPVLHALLERKEMRGYAIRSYRDAVQANAWALHENDYRNRQLKEFYLAKALAACDPNDPLAAETLDSYRNSLNGCFAMYA